MQSSKSVLSINRQNITIIIRNLFQNELLINQINFKSLLEFLINLINKRSYLKSHRKITNHDSLKNRELKEMRVDSY